MAIEIIFKNEACEWLDCEQPTPEDLAFLHTAYGINMLMLEDTVDTNHLPKYEQSGSVKLFLTRENTELERKTLNNISDVSTKMSFFLMENVLITVHRMKNRSIYEYKKDIFGEEEPITPKLIALRLSLKILKSYDEESQRIMAKLDAIENEIFLSAPDNANHIRRLYKLKRKAGLNSRILNLSSEWVTNMRKIGISESEFIDLQDSYKDVIADFEHLTAQVTNLISMYIAMSDQRANQVMKLLAIYSVYFLPITFIAGLYGMNFDIMPELHHKYGYFITLGFMALIVLCTFIYFKRKKW